MKINIGIFKLKTPLHALSEPIGMKTELYQTDVKIQGFINEALFQYKYYIVQLHNYIFKSVINVTVSYA